MFNIDRDKKDELFYTISCSSETPQMLDIEEIRPRLMPMEGRCPNPQYICNDVRFRESNDAVPRKGFFERGDKKIKENDIFANVIYSHCYLAGRGVYWHKIPKLQITPPKIRIREEDLSRSIHIEFI